MVEWVDASTHGGPGWVPRDEATDFAAEPPPVMKTVGFLLHKTEEEGPDGWIAITDTLGDDETASVHKIPNPMIIRLEIFPHETV